VPLRAGFVASIQRVAARIKAISLRSTSIDGGMYGAFSNAAAFSHSNRGILLREPVQPGLPVNPAATWRPLRAIAMRRKFR
jgi:hypothetical protein